MKSTKIISIIIFSFLSLSFTSLAQASSCSRLVCIPKVGEYGGPNPQGLTSSYASTATSFTVKYIKGDEEKKSTYGNSVTSANVYARYKCKNANNPWIETGANFYNTVAKIASNGKGRAVVKPFGYAGTHTWTFKFTRTTLSGHVSGSYKSSTGEMCKLSTDFKAKLKK